MRIPRVALLCLLVFSAALAVRAEESPSDFSDRLDQSIARGLEALLARQAADGGWHSNVYGHLKPGVAQTALALATLSQWPVGERANFDAAIHKAVNFLIASEGPDGSLGTHGEWLEFPAYSNALATLALSRMAPEHWRKTIEPWVAYLRKNQHSEENGCAADDPAYGGWGPQGIPPAGRRRQADLASTRCALQGLAAAGVARDDKVWARARIFLARVQNFSKGGGDGGFFFSTTHVELNKAGTSKRDEKGFRSYGSCTADGLIALSLAPGDDAAARLAAASKWFADHAATRTNPGFDGTNMEAQGWQDGLNFYYRAAIAEAASHADPPNLGPLSSAWWRELAQVTLEARHQDGTWASATTAMKENDPLTATPLALQTLLACRAHISLK